MPKQSELQARDLWLPVGGPRLKVSLGADDPMPSGPYRVSLTWCGKVDRRYRVLTGVGSWSLPYTVRARNRQVVAGNIPSLDCAKTIVASLNSPAPA